MNIKDVTTMLRKKEISDLAKYILAGKNVQGVCLMQVVDLLSAYGVTKTMLIEKGVIISINDLLKNLLTHRLNESYDIDTKKLLKHYHYVLSTALQSWRDKTLIPSSQLLIDLDNRVVNHLLARWNQYLANGGMYPENCAMQPDNYISHIECSIMKKVLNFSSAIKSCNDDLTEAQLGKYRNILADKIMEDWKSNTKSDFNNIKNHLDSLLINHLVEAAKNNQLEEALQQVVARKLHDVLTLHSSVLGDFDKFTGLNESAKSILQTLQKGNIFKNYSTEIVDLLVQNYGKLTKQAGQDIDNILRDEVMPKILATNGISGNFKLHIVMSAIKDKRENEVNFEISNYIQKLFNDTIAKEVRADMCLNRNSFNGVIESIIRSDVAKFKGDDGLMRLDMPGPETCFADIYSVIAQLQYSISGARVADDLKSLAEQNKALAKKVDDLTFMLESLIEAQQISKAPQSTATQASSYLTFFGKSSPDNQNNQGGPKLGK